MPSSFERVVSPGFPERLRARMKAREIGTVELAARSGLNKETVSTWTRGERRSYTFSKVSLLAAVLETSAEELLEIAIADADRSGAKAQAAQLGLARRVAALQPLLDRVPELEEAVREARRISGEG